jgi:hypothetical protein
VDHGEAAATQLVGQFDHDAGHFAITVAAIVSGKAAYLDIFVRLVKRNGLDDELIRRDWDSFARQYNGPKYSDNKYDAKLAAACAFYRAGGPHVDLPNPVLQMGDKGEAVNKLRGLLKIGADGDFGPGTKAAVVKFQKAKGLYQDGIVGKGTWAALGGVGIKSMMAHLVLPIAFREGIKQSVPVSIQEPPNLALRKLFKHLERSLPIIGNYGTFL